MLGTASRGAHVLARREDPTDRRAPVWERHGPLLLGGAVTLVMFAVLCARNSYVFTYHIYEDGDAAANSFLVHQALHLHLLTGNYSRTGFYHPGPALLYVQAAGQAVFHSILHVVPTPYNGQLLAGFLLNSVLCGLAVVVVYRCVRNPLLAVGLISVVLVGTGTSLVWASLWMPYFYVASFLLVTIAGASVAAGSLADLPIFVLASGLLVHGHVAFIAIVGLFSVFVAASWALHMGSVRRIRGSIRQNKGGIYLALGIGVLFLLPIVLELVLHWPGQWGRYISYSSSESRNYHHTLGQALSYVRRYWPAGIWTIVLYLVAGCVGLVLAAKDPDRRRGRFLTSVIGSVVVITAVTGLYALRGIDYLSYPYTGFFYYVVPPLTVAVGGVALGARLCRVLAGRAVVLVGAATLTVIASFQGSFVASNNLGDPSLPTMVAAVRSAARASRVAASEKIIPVNLTVPQGWPTMAGFVLAALREGLPVCSMLSSRPAVIIFTEQNTCTNAERRGQWRVLIDKTNVSGGLSRVAARSNGVVLDTS